MRVCLKTHWALLLLTVAVESFAQVMSPRAASQQPAAVQKVSLNLPALVVPSKTQLLIWDAPAEVLEWRVFIGASRNNWSTNFVVNTRSVPITSGQHYGVSNIAFGSESEPAYWPSNRVVALDVEVTDTLRNQFVGSFTWLTWTNAPGDAPSKYLRLKERLLRWE